MSGHSKWATTKHKKAVIDARRGKMFAKLIKNIEVAARMGGGDLAGNPTLYDAVQKAKKSSVPNDNIDRAVKRGSGAEAGGADYTTIMYEGYGPNGVAFLIECLTDNKNRAAMEVRTAMNRNGGSLADPGSVSYMFQRKGVVIVPQEQDGKRVSEDDVLEATLDAGAEDVNDLGEAFEVVSEATDLVASAPLCRQPGSTTTPPTRRSCRRCRSSSTRTAPARCSGSTRRSRISTTCRTCSPTSTCPTT
jgi:YebC/PmpR family DNA-binding regulatory protein